MIRNGREITDEKEKALAEKCWDYRANRENPKPNDAPLGTLVGGCPKCGHLCSFEEKEMHCYKSFCNWDWKNEVKHVQ